MDNLPAVDGPLTLCGRFTDQLGNQQPSPTSYSWTKQTFPPTATVTSGLPLSPSPAASSNIQIGGTRVTTYQFALLKSSDSDCQTGLNFGPWTNVSANSTLSVAPPTDGFMTLCVLGMDEAGNIQTTPTIYRWLRIAGIPAPTTTNVFATITKGAKARTSQTLLFKRTGASLPKESVTARVCAVTARTGTLSKCNSQTISFAKSAAEAKATFTGLSVGKWVGVLLPRDGSRGRVEPLVFDF